MKKPRILAPAVLAAAALMGCGGPPPAATTPTSQVTPAPAPTAAPTAVAEPAPPDGEPVVRLHPVAQIYSLIDVAATDGGVEVRLGHDPGGGQIGRYRYAPIVNGVVDLDQETAELTYANTASQASVRLAGKRPDLVYHAASGFRSSAVDNYLTLRPDGTWIGFSAGEAPGIGVGIFSWSQDRLLEWREPLMEERSDSSATPHLLPGLRALRGADKEAPSIPAALKKRLQKEGFYLSTLTAFRTGEVIAAGLVSSDATKLGTLLWRDKLRSPDYFTTPVDAGKEEPPDPVILGGDSLANVRLRCGDRVMKLDGTSWVLESTVADEGLPEVWFGAPQVMATDHGAFARMAAGSPWMPLALTRPEGTEVIAGDTTGLTFVVDSSGVIWTTIDDLLFSSKPPASGQIEITEAELVKRRKASILRGGSADATGQDPGAGAVGKCTTHYVLLDQMAIPATDTTDYPTIRSALKGHPELGKVRLVVSREKGQQLFGAQAEDEKLASQLAALVQKSVKGAPVRSMCAEPTVLRQVKIDFATGEILK